MSLTTGEHFSTLAPALPAAPSAPAAVAPPARTRLLHELDRAGASSEFLRLYFLLRRELTPADLRAIEQSFDRHLAGWVRRS